MDFGGGNFAEYVWQWSKFTLCTRESNRASTKTGQIHNHFLFIKNKQLFISTEGFSTLEKKRPDMWAMLPFQSGVNKPLQIIMAVWRPFCLNSNFLGRVWQPSAENNGAQKAFNIYRGLSHHTRSLSRIVCRGRERPKGRKGTLRPDFQANTRPRIF